MFPLAEALWGRTFGKWACDLRVVALNGHPVATGQAFGRRVLDPVDLLVFFGLVAFIVSKTNPLSQRLGDLVARTRVVDYAADEATPPDLLCRRRDRGRNSNVRRCRTEGGFSGRVVHGVIDLAEV